jgi:hypothetical protein
MSTTKEQREFDNWFFKQTFVKQAECRSLGIIPYREQPQERFSFPIFANAKCFAYDPWDVEMRSEEDTFVSRERLREIISKILLTLERSPERSVRLHVELLRLVLRTPDAMTNGELCSQYPDITRQGIHYRVQEMRRILFGKKPSTNKGRNKTLNENIQRKTEASGSLQLQQLQGKVPAERRKIKGVSKAKVSNSKRTKETHRKSLERKKPNTQHKD